MIKPIDIPIIGDDSNIAQDDPQRTLNFYAEETGDKVYTLKPTPGTEIYATPEGRGGGRGMIVVAGRLFTVRGAFLLESINGNTIQRGRLHTIDGKVGMVSNLPPDGEGQILIVDAGTGYVFSLADNSFVDIATLGTSFAGGGSQCAFVAGRGVVLKPGTLQWQVSGLYDFLTWDAGGIAFANSLEGELLAAASNGTLLYLFSSGGFELWGEDDSDVALPLQRILAGDKIGVLAPDSVLFSERYCYWLGATSEGRGVAYRHSGGAKPERLTNHSNERQIAALANPGDAVAQTYQSLGHTFYILTFRDGNVTLVYDTVTLLWHERAQRNALTGSLFALPFIAIVIFDGLLLGCDYRDGKVWRIDDELFTDDGNPIRRERVMQPIPEEADSLTYFQSIELFATIGNTPVDQPNPQIMLRCSYDRGMTWGLEMWQQSGGNATYLDQGVFRQGDAGYAGRTKWTGLGAAYGLVPWFAIVASQFISWRSVRVRAE